MFECMVVVWCCMKRIWHCRGCGLGQWGIGCVVLVVQSGFVTVVCPVLGTWVEVSDGGGMRARCEWVHGSDVPCWKRIGGSMCAWVYGFCGNQGKDHVCDYVRVSTGGSGDDRVVCCDLCEECCCVVVGVFGVV